ncbi:MAG: flavin reductase family protein [Leptospira sp.]|jgi:flavin reductase (DIM6/NTAB) family NADH-FMN oxidoreductase RutF|nr:flavin reductase family protein [Leptospira sp.]
MPITKDEFKQALSLWASGVTAITYQSKSKSGGITVSSFSSLSLDPPLVLFCLQNGSGAKDAILEAGCFGVNILSSKQKQISADFASGSLDKAVVLENLKPIQLKTGAPLLPECLVSMDCKLESVVEKGDHCIVIGLVEAQTTKEDAPLLYFHRNYRELT